LSVQSRIASKNEAHIRAFAEVLPYVCWHCGRFACKNCISRLFAISTAHSVKRLVSSWSSRSFEIGDSDETDALRIDPESWPVANLGAAHCQQDRLALLLHRQSRRDSERILQPQRELHGIQALFWPSGSRVEAGASIERALILRPAVVWLVQRGTEFAQVMDTWQRMNSCNGQQSGNEFGEDRSFSSADFSDLVRSMIAAKLPSF
jgi:hypothetical protein